MTSMRMSVESMSITNQPLAAPEQGLALQRAVEGAFPAAASRARLSGRTSPCSEIANSTDASPPSESR